MDQYETAVVPLDGSEFSRKALAHVARINPKAVILISVMESVASALSRQTGIVADVPPDVARKVSEAEQSRLRADLDAAREELRGLGWTGAVNPLVVTGSPGEQIVAATRDLSADLVVMTTHGRKGIRRAMLGSVAEHVVREVKETAVLLVRP